MSFGVVGSVLLTVQAIAAPTNDSWHPCIVPDVGIAERWKVTSASAGVGDDRRELLRLADLVVAGHRRLCRRQPDASRGEQNTEGP